MRPLQTTLEKTVFNVFALKIAAVVLFFALNLSVLKTAADGLAQLVLLWGAAIFLYDLAVRRRALQGPGSVFLWLFLLFYAVSVALNLHAQPKNEMALYGYLLVALLLFYPLPKEDGGEETLLRQLRILTGVYLGLTAAACTASFVIFVIRYDTTFVYGGISYYVGVYEHRLWGIFSNPNSPAVLNGAVLSLLQLTLLKKETAHRRWKQAAVLYTLLISLVTLILGQSNGLLISLAVFVFLMAGYVGARCVEKRWKWRGAAALGFLLAAVLSVAALFTVFEYGRQGLSYLPVLVQRLESLTSSDGFQPEEPVDLERDPSADGSDEMTGRPEIWRRGFQAFLKKPLFGNASARHTEEMCWHDRQLLHFHNIVVQALASSGIAGTLALGAFALHALAGLIRGRQRFASPTVAVLGAFLMMHLVNNMGEVTLLFRAELSLFSFWIYFGYLMALVNLRRPESAPDRLFRRLLSGSFRQKSLPPQKEETR